MLSGHIIDEGILKNVQDYYKKSKSFRATWRDPFKVPHIFLKMCNHFAGIIAIYGERAKRRQ